MAIFVEFESAQGKGRFALRADRVEYIASWKGEKESMGRIAQTDGVTLVATMGNDYVVIGHPEEILHAIVGALEGRLSEARLEENRGVSEIPEEKGK